MSAIDYWDSIAEAEQVGVPMTTPVVFATKREQREAQTEAKHRAVVSPHGHHAHWCEECERVHYYLQEGECE